LEYAHNHLLLSNSKPQLNHKGMDTPGLQKQADWQDENKNQEKSVINET
jgi:hypothetical protein